MQGISYVDECWASSNPIQDGSESLKICHNDKTWHSYNLLKEDQKNR